MKKSIRIKLKRNGSTVKVKVLIKHPMETGLRKNGKTQALIPAHFIKELVCLHNDKLVLDAMWGVAISKNPYISFFIDNVNPGDKVKIDWKDNLGNSDTITKTIS